jgi:dTMP kinase
VQHDASAPGGLRQPDLTLWFDLPPAAAAARRAAARPADRLEREDSAFFERVRAAYAQRAAQAAARFVRIDADQALAAVWAQVQAAVDARLPV